MTNQHEDRAYIDPAACRWLGDDGLAGFELAETIGPGGERKLWLLDTAQVGVPGVDLGTEEPEHESLGPLPERVRHRIRAAPIRCGQPCADGHPCRIAVSRQGHVCGWHRNPRPAQEAER